jgi:CRP-like cAMP-binding protein/rhodanese-related sulfurtransferase
LKMDDKTEIRDTLAKSVLFGSLSQEALEAIAEVALTMTISPDTTLAKMGDTGKVCCIIISGKVKLSRPGKAGLEYVLAQLGPGESFGEFNLLSNEPVPASVKTVEETRLIMISRDQFEPIMKKYPEVTAAVGKGFSHWLQRAGSLIERQTKLQFEAHHMRWIDFIPIVLISLIFAIAFNASNPKGIPFFQKSFADSAVSFVDPSEVYEKYQRGELLIVDANPTIFYEPEHIKNALSLPLSTFDFMYDLRLAKTDKSKEIIVYGRTISEHYDEKVAEKLVIRGFEKVRILKGGLSAWKEKNYPVEP